MAKQKLQRFAEIGTFKNVIQPHISFPPIDHELKGNWGHDFFHNDNPIVLELGCGRGEYTVFLADRFPEKNFIGIDVKGNRLWRGAKSALEKELSNTAFLRVPIDHIQQFFSIHEVSEIWITFPDPQPQESCEKKRLTSSRFLSRYKTFLKPGGIIHLKTDHLGLFEFSLDVAVKNQFNIGKTLYDLYNNKELLDDILSVKTTYEQAFLKQGEKIYYFEILNRL